MNLKPKCCKKYRRKAKACKRCPLMARLSPEEREHKLTQARRDRKKRKAEKKRERRKKYRKGERKAA